MRESDAATRLCFYRVLSLARELAWRMRADVPRVTTGAAPACHCTATSPASPAVRCQPLASQIEASAGESGCVRSLGPANEPFSARAQLQPAKLYLASHRHSRRRAGVQNRPARPLHTALPAKSGGPVSNSCDATAPMAEIASATMPAGEMPKPRRQKKVFKPPSDAQVCKTKVRSPVYLDVRAFENWSGRAQRAAAATSLDAAGAPRPDTAA